MAENYNPFSSVLAFSLFIISLPVLGMDGYYDELATQDQTGSNTVCEKCDRTNVWGVTKDEDNLGVGETLILDPGRSVPAGSSPNGTVLTDLTPSGATRPEVVPALQPANHSPVIDQILATSIFETLAKERLRLRSAIRSISAPPEQIQSLLHFVEDMLDGVIQAALLPLPQHIDRLKATVKEGELDPESRQLLLDGFDAIAQALRPPEPNPEDFDLAFQQLAEAAEQVGWPQDTLGAWDLNCIDIALDCLADCDDNDLGCIGWCGFIYAACVAADDLWPSGTSSGNGAVSSHDDWPAVQVCGDIFDQLGKAQEHGGAQSCWRIPAERQLELSNIAIEDADARAGLRCPSRCPARFDQGVSGGCFNNNPPTVEVTRRYRCQ